MDLFNKFAKQATSSNNSDNQNQQQQPQQQSSDSSDLFGKLSSFAGGNKPAEQPKTDTPQQQPPSDGLLGELQGLAGGGAQSEQKEDGLDKGIDWVQENVFKQGAQDNESAGEQAKDRLIAQTIRDQYKKNLGNEFPKQRD
ncbi:hypothetical protein B0H63DRAFT_122718 [Podospora didyma]|uniref:DNA damage-responsive protein 48 n=1 Tax=Podospora didyma TaxID=330526 RepID=A0AAE0NZZ2_9PEZI|nr:hypothetical protein B0H63DRAFT_122718 [Podospora didyma]